MLGVHCRYLLGKRDGEIVCIRFAVSSVERSMDFFYYSTVKRELAMGRKIEKDYELQKIEQPTF